MAKFLRSDTAILVLIALIFVVLQLATSTGYGFHRDELATLDDAQHMDWGFVAYPPLTPAFGRISLMLFGVSTLGARLFPILALAVAVVFSGLMARELGGPRRAQILSALAVACVPIVVIETAVLQYVSFDYLWGVLLAYFLVRLLASNDPRWWLAIGAAIGLGMMTKYTMAFFVIAMVAGLVVAGFFDIRIRRWLASPWLWAGVALSLIIFLPNFLWQLHHEFISLDFLKHIHARDVRLGRTQGFLPQQLYVCVGIMLAPLVFMGLWFYCKWRDRKFLVLGLMFIFALALFAVAKGRSYYLGPMYPMLFAAGSVVWDDWVASRGRTAAGVIQRVTWIGLAVSLVISFIMFKPVAPINSGVWKATSKFQDNFVEEIGWTDLVATVSHVYQSIPADQRATTGIMVGNYGEAGAIDLYGPVYGLPRAINGTNTNWYRTYPSNEPQTLIVVGIGDDFRSDHFENCEVVAHNGNPYGVVNEESRDHPDIYLCHHVKPSWKEMWPDFQWFG